MRFIFWYNFRSRKFDSPEIGSRARLETLNQGKYVIYEKMASSGNAVNGDDLQEQGGQRGTADLEAELKRKKFRAKLNFTRIKNKIIF